MADFLLSDLVETNPGEKWFDHPHKPFRVLVAFIEADERDRLALQSTTLVRKAEDGFKPKQEFDPVVFNKKLANRVVKSWEGLTSEVLKKFFKGAKANFDSLPESGLPANDANKLFMLQKCPSFDNWVLSIATDWELFNQQVKEAELENLGTSSPG